MKIFAALIPFSKRRPRSKKFRMIFLFQKKKENRQFYSTTKQQREEKRKGKEKQTGISRAVGIREHWREERERRE